MGTIKDRNGMDLTGAKDIKKRWQDLYLWQIHFDICQNQYNTVKLKKNKIT